MSGPKPPRNSEPFLVGEILVFPERNELRPLDQESGRPSEEVIRLTAKQMDVLVVLASRPGQAIGKNELLEEVWPGVVVGEDNITSCIYELRKAFGHQDYIKTVRQRGYLLTANVTRPLPARLIEELAPARPASAEILLAEVASARSDETGAARPEIPIPALPESQIRRALLLWLSPLVLLLAIGLALVSRVGTFTVGLGGFENTSTNPDLDKVAASLERRFFTTLGDPEKPTYYRLRELRLLAGTVVHGEVALDGNRLLLRAKVSGNRGGPGEWVKVSGPLEQSDPLIDRLLESIGRVLDGQACRMDSDVDLIKARHCRDAGSRLLTARSYDEARELLERAAGFYEQLRHGPDAAAARDGLLNSHDSLANLYDILGDRAAARSHIQQALALLEEPSAPAPEPKRLLQVRRRAAQIEGDVVTERQLLQQLRDLEPQAPQWRHSLGWFLRTHDRDCDFAELQFDEALFGPSDDARTRAAYYSYKGGIQMACDHPVEAIDSFNRHVEAAPDFGDPYDMRADAYLTVGHYEEARQDLNTAYQLDPLLGSALKRKGHLELELGHYLDARREYDSFLKAFGHWPNPRRDGLIALGRLALLENKPEEAALLAREASELQGGSRVQAFWLLGLAAIARRRPDEAHAALAELETMFAATPSRFQREYLCHLRAQLALAEGRGEVALHELTAAINNRPTERLFFLAERAAALHQLGRLQEAFAAYQDILAINSRHPRSLCAAALLAESLATPAAANALYTRARDILGQQTDDPSGRICLERGRALEQRLAGGDGSL